LIGVAPGRVRVHALHDEAMKVADIGLPQRLRLSRQIAPIMQRLEVPDRFEMILERLAADGDPVLDHHPRFGGGQRIALDRVRRVGQFDVVGTIQVVIAMRSGQARTNGIPSPKPPCGIMRWFCRGRGLL
jgi:hypothetical protein